MYYTNDYYKTEIKNYIDNVQTIIENIKKIDNTYKIGKIEAELSISLIIRSCGQLELFFDDIMLEFAKKHSSKIFYNYFNNNFTKEGKNVSPDKINQLMKNLSIDIIDKTSCQKQYIAFSSLYDIRNNIAHGQCNIGLTINQIIEFINESISYLNIVIEKLDSVKIS